MTAAALATPRPAAEITRLLAAAGGGDAQAGNALFNAVYGELRSLAHAALWHAPAPGELDARALVSEAWLRMNDRDGLAFASRNHFFAYAARVMRSVIVDQLREAAAAKRGGGLREVTLSTSIEDAALHGPGLVAVDRALKAFERVDARGHQVFEMHFFAGMAVDDICAATALSPATVKRDLRKARAFLFEELGPGARP